MNLTPPEKKLLKNMIKVQGSLSCYVVFGTDNHMYRATGLSREDADNAVTTNTFSIPVKLSDPVLQATLQHLRSNGLILRPVMAEIYQVTYEGWYNAYILRSEKLSSFLNHFLFPCLVAFFTTLLTLFVSS